MSPPKSALHAEARRLASNGVPVFPCAPDQKRPWTEHGFHDATCDLAQVDLWWSEEPRLNIAYCPHTVGEAIIDLDGQEGEDAWDYWQIEHGYLPLTRTIQTPRGGRHLVYRGCLPPTQSAIGTHVDTRGAGSYALLPPSSVGGRPYVVVDDRPVAELGEAVGAFLAGLRRERVQAAVGELDLPQNVARAAHHLRQLVAAGKVAVEGHNGNKTTYVTACDVMNLGCSEAKTLELMSEIWDPHCSPPWGDELEVVVHNAASYAQNEAGAWGVGSSQDTFASALDKLAPDDLEGPTTSAPREHKGSGKFKRWTLGEMLALPEPEWLLPDLMPAGGVSVLYGQPGTLKTYIAIEWSCQLASLGIPVLYVAAEGSIGVSRRIAAWCLTHEVEPSSLAMEVVRAAPAIAEEAQMAEFYREVVAFKPTLIVVDTLARTMAGLDENTSRDMGQLVARMDELRVGSGAAVLLLHHSGKDGDRGPRGSGALIGGVDAMFEATRPNRDVPLVTIKCTRQKDAEERAAPWYYEGRKIGAQMVMQECSVADFHAGTSTLPKVDPKEVGRILREIGAVDDYENGVETRVLAVELASRHGKTPEEQDALVNGYATVLGRGAGGLRNYQAGDPPRWWLPPAD